MIKPFERDIPWYPGEPKSDLPTLETTRLLDPVVQMSIDLVSKFTSPENNSKARGEIWKNIITLCGNQDHYKALRSVIKDQLETADEKEVPATEMSMHRELLDKLENLFEPVPNLKIRLRVQPHGISRADYGDTIVKLLKEMKQIFNKGEDNIFFCEDSSRDTHPDLDKGFEKYGNMRMAKAYESCKISYNREPTPADMEFALDYIEGVKSKCTDKEGLYTYAVDEAFDQLQEEGYKVKVVYEKGIKDQSRPSAKSPIVRSIGELKAHMQKIHQVRCAREQVIVKQFEDLAEKVRNLNKQTNVFGLFGTAHYGLFRLLPVSIRQVTEVSHAERWGTEGIFADIQRKMIDGEPVDDAMWMEAFNSLQSNVVFQPAH